VGLGIGAGWMREEFELLEQPFSRRGKRMDEMIEVMRTLWGGGFVEHHGAEYDFEPVDMRPAPSAPIPIFVGGHSEVALKRAARLDGWIGVNYSMERLAELCEQLHAYRRELGTDPAGPYEIVASPLAAPTPENVEQLEAMGVTTVLTSAWMAFRKPAPRTLEEAREVLSAYAERFINPLRGTN
jgi:alkanesulfonate monooxygenase SsuD/methylene tetrahydromethanopterin reductase-like flavin-dependent oxidoreductase (luciferase family)